MNLSDLLAKASDLLKGEPARVIGYGAAVIVYIAAKALNVIPDQSFDQSIALTVSAIALVGTVVESIRHLVTPAAAAEAAVQEALYTPVPGTSADDIVLGE